ncbi:MAG: hypothetical protein J1E07_02615 [Treponema sp.]|nr:hypothetical protein [Treponema sp.]
MDFADFFDGIKEKFSETTETLLDWIEENKKVAIIISSLVIVILLCLVLLAASVSSAKKKKNAPRPRQELILSEPLLIPDGPELPRDYTLTRRTKEKWTDEEADPWFTVPSEKEIDSLSRSNESMVNEIIKAAP